MDKKELLNILKEHLILELSSEGDMGGNTYLTAKIMWRNEEGNNIEICSDFLNMDILK